MGTSENQISVKATTTDGLGYIGKSEGWSALAIATISQKYFAEQKNKSAISLQWSK